MKTNENHPFRQQVLYWGVFSMEWSNIRRVAKINVQILGHQWQLIEGPPRLIDLYSYHYMFSINLSHPPDIKAPLILNPLAASLVFIDFHRCPRCFSINLSHPTDVNPPIYAINANTTLDIKSKIVQNDENQCKPDIPTTGFTSGRV